MKNLEESDEEKKKNISAYFAVKNMFLLRGRIRWMCITRLKRAHERTLWRQQFCYWLLCSTNFDSSSFFFFFSILRSLIHDSCKLLETEHEAANVCSQFVSIGRSFRANQSWKKLEIFNFGDVLCFYCTILGNDGIQAVLLHRAVGNLRHWVPLSSLFVPFYVWYETWFSNFSRCFS